MDEEPRSLRGTIELCCSTLLQLTQALRGESPSTTSSDSSGKLLLNVLCKREYYPLFSSLAPSPRLTASTPMAGRRPEASKFHMLTDCS